jgi:hypothetical protein
VSDEQPPPAEAATPPEEEGPRAWSPGDRAVRPPVEDEDGTLRCGYCGTPLAEDQTYCLECGSPTPVAPGLRRSKAAAAIALGLVVLGVGAGILAFVIARDDDDTAGVTTTALTIPPASQAGEPTLPTDVLPTDTTFAPTGEETVTDLFPTDTTATGTVTAPDPGETFPTVTGTEGTVPEPADPTTTAEDPFATAPDPVDPVDPVEPGGGDDWPAGRTAWTAILSSVRVEADARAAADRLDAQGTAAGVLVSDEHPGLVPGYYVVFSGVLDSRQAAIDRAARLSGEFPGAYARQITG